MHNQPITIENGTDEMGSIVSTHYGKRRTHKSKKTQKLVRSTVRLQACKQH